ncbi:MAG: shikimate dehydrogenase [FCB group bacterium]|nr:shikimate dehydrogenase [FCB group bacterium]
MKKFAVIGNPLAHSLSPQLHGLIFQQLGLEAQYYRVECSQEDLRGVVASMKSGDLDGANITLPYKTKIMSLLDELNIKAQHIGAVNCLVNDKGSVIGFNTDWFGFSMAMRAFGVEINGGDFILLGAGGAARGVLYTLMREGAKSVVVVNRSAARAAGLIDHFQRFRGNTAFTARPMEDLSRVPEEICIINCTPVGMWPEVEATPFPHLMLGEGHVLVDTIYTPLETHFLKRGRMQGAKTINGLNMFIYQALASLDLWFGEELSAKVDVRALKTYLEDLIENA